MPAISIKSIALAESQKKVLAKKYVEIFAEITNVPKDRVYIFFDGHELEDVGTAGIRFSDHASKAWSKFNEDEWSKDPAIVAKIEKAGED